MVGMSSWTHAESDLELSDSDIVGSSSKWERSKKEKKNIGIGESCEYEHGVTTPVAL